MDLSSWLARLHPFDYAQGRPFDYAQGRPFDYAQGRLQAPATLLLVALQPLSWFAGELLTAAAPLLPLDAERVAGLGKRLSDDDELDRLVAEWFGERA